MEQNRTYPDFEEWRENAIPTASGLKLAPEDFYVQDGIGQRKKHFNWDEAMKYEKAVLRPNGWRLPTRDEWIKIANEFKTPDKLRYILRLGLNGTICWYDMNKYRQNPNKVRTIFQDVCGYYWSSTKANEAETYFMFLNESITNPAGDSGVCSGFSMRCLAV